MAKFFMATIAYILVPISVCLFFAAVMNSVTKSNLWGKQLILANGSRERVYNGMGGVRQPLKIRKQKDHIFTHKYEVN